MSNQTPADPNDLPPGGFSLGGALADGFDHSLEAQPAPPDLILPRGALVVFAQSGGFRFTSRQCVVYRSGRVERSNLNGPARPTYLSAAEFGRLYHLLLRARLGIWAKHVPPAPPDGYSYEILARYGSNLRFATFIDGAIPSPVAPLIRVLQRLLD